MLSMFPPPPIPPDIDLRDMPIPRDFFARLAVETFGISYAVALRMTNEAADRIEETSRRVRRRRDKLQKGV